MNAVSAMSDIARQADEKIERCTIEASKSPDYQRRVRIIISGPDRDYGWMRRGPFIGPRWRAESDMVRDVVDWLGLEDNMLEEEYDDLAAMASACEVAVTTGLYQPLQVRYFWYKRAAR